jgi:hypothetical protein
MAGKLRVPRSRGAVTGVLLILLGAWGGLIPFIGPYFHYAYTPADAWRYTEGRLWLEILPALGAIVGGAILLVTTWRPVAVFGAWLAAVSGAWLVVGGALAPLWTRAGVAGAPVGGSVARAVEQVGFFSGLGVVLAFLAAAAIGRLSVAAVAPALAPASVSAPASDRQSPAALLRRVVSGKRAGSPAGSKDSKQQANITS